MRPSLLVFAVAALITAPVITSAAEDAAKTEAVNIASACADIWATKTPVELNAVGGLALGPFEARAKALALELDDAQEAYGNTQLDYIVAHKRATAALERLAASTVDMALNEAKKKQEAVPSDSSLLDSIVDRVAKADGQGLTDMALVGVNDAATDALLQEQARAEKAMIAAKKAALAVEAKANAVAFAISSIRACINDQASYLGNQGAQTAEPESPSLPAVGGYRMDALFAGTPTRRFDIPAATGDIPYSPAPCHDACMASGDKCVAWNYTYDAAAAGLPPAQCSIYEDSAALGETISSSGFSGYGPKAAELGLAAAATQ